MLQIPGFSDRWFAFNAPYTARNFAVPFHDHDWQVGRNFFRGYARKHRSRMRFDRDRGLIPSFAALDDGEFRADHVDPLIREFYEHTRRFDIYFSIRWNPWLRPLGFAYYHLVARFIDQLKFPPADSVSMIKMRSNLSSIDVDGDGDADFTCWGRVVSSSKSLLYIAAVRTYVATENERTVSYLNISFPLPASCLTVALRPRNLAGAGFGMSTRVVSDDAGSYLVLPHTKSFSMLPGLGLSEEFEFYRRVDERGPFVEGRHRQFWLNTKVFSVRYRLQRRPAREKSRAPIVRPVADAAAHDPATLDAR